MHAVSRTHLHPEPRSEVWWWNLRWHFGGTCFWLFPSKRSSKIIFQTSPEIRHQFRRNFRQLHSGSRWCLCFPCKSNQGPKVEHKLFFLKLFGHLRDIPAKSWDILPKKFDFPGFEGQTEPFGPHPFTWKTPTPPEYLRTQKFGFGFLFRAWELTFFFVLPYAQGFYIFLGTPRNPDN